MDPQGEDKSHVTVLWSTTQWVTLPVLLLMCPFQSEGGRGQED